MEEDSLDFNFWPSFADMMLGLVLVLVLVMFLFVGVKAVGTLDLRVTEKRQFEVVNSIAASYRARAEERAAETKDDTKERVRVFCITLSKPGECGITIRNEAKLQRITFSEYVLFDVNESGLKPQGRDVLNTVAEALKKQLKDIKEIQIQGHADPTRKADSNMYNVNLAALRAMAVYDYFMNSAQIDPAENLMSATTFGEFNPVQRAAEKGAYDRDKLSRDNSDKGRRDNNRRVELLLFY